MIILGISSVAVICQAVINIGNFQLIWRIFRRALELGNIHPAAVATHSRQLTEPEIKCPGGKSLRNEIHSEWAIVYMACQSGLTVSSASIPDNL